MIDVLSTEKKINSGCFITLLSTVDVHVYLNVFSYLIFAFRCNLPKYLLFLSSCSLQITETNIDDGSVFYKSANIFCRLKSF